jgi:hypothetical protein
MRSEFIEKDRRHEQVTSVVAPSRMGWGCRVRALDVLKTTN